MVSVVSIGSGSRAPETARGAGAGTWRSLVDMDRCSPNMGGRGTDAKPSRNSRRERPLNRLWLMPMLDKDMLREIATETF